MNEPKTNLTVEDIHRIRERNYELTKDMKPEDRRAYYQKNANAVQAQSERLRQANGIPARNSVRI